MVCKVTLGTGHRPFSKETVTPAVRRAPGRTVAEDAPRLPDEGFGPVSAGRDGHGHLVDRTGQGLAQVRLTPGRLGHHRGVRPRAEHLPVGVVQSPEVGGGQQFHDTSSFTNSLYRYSKPELLYRSRRGACQVCPAVCDGIGAWVRTLSTSSSVATRVTREARVTASRCCDVTPGAGS